MLTIGCHLSSANGYVAMGEEALSIGADTFQFFTRNPRGSKAKTLDMDDVTAFNALAAEQKLLPVLAHAPYTLNPASKEERIHEFALMTIADDLSRLSFVPGSMYNLHPGSHVGQGAEEGIRQTAAVLNQVLESETSTPVLLETMSGKGSEVGKTFAELRAILDLTEQNHRLGICLDTCHVYCAGYDIVNCLNDVLEEFDRVLGLDRLLAIHLNDSLHPLGSHKDRHANIGQGTLGLSAFSACINHPALRHLPFYLETPTDSAGHGEEIKLLKDLYRD